MEAIELIEILDSTASLAIAVWVIAKGLEFSREQRQESNRFAESTMKELSSNNNELMELVQNLCSQVRFPNSSSEDKS